MRKGMREVALSRGAAILLVTLIGSSLNGQCPKAPADSSFAPVLPPGSPPIPYRKTLLEPRSNTGGTPVQFNITRVVGPGTTDEFNPDGTLKYWDQYVANHVLEGTAHLEIGYWAVGSGPCNGSVCWPLPPAFAQGGIGLMVNGHAETPSISSVNLFNGASVCLELSTRYLKFPTRAAPGSVPQPALNNIDLVFSQPETVVQTLDFGIGEICNGNQCSNDPLKLYLYGDYAPSAGVGHLTIKAMAPIILVHGIRATADWFPTNGLPNR